MVRDINVIGWLYGKRIEDYDLSRWFSYEYQRNLIRIRYKSNRANWKNRRLFGTR